MQVETPAEASAETPKTPAPRLLTEDVPRIYTRRLPDPTHRELLRRSRTIAKVVAIHFTPTAFRQLRTIRQGPLPAAQLARPLRKSFQDLGGTFMKFGQIIASSPGMFGDEVADEFRACLDTGPPVPFPEVRQRVEEDLGRPFKSVFAAFETEPIGTASIAVVHRARLHDGRVVAVKVLRPGIGPWGATGCCGRASSTWWRRIWTSCNRCWRFWCASRATSWPGRRCRCSTGSGC